MEKNTDELFRVFYKWMGDKSNALPIVMATSEEGVSYHWHSDLIYVATEDARQNWVFGHAVVPIRAEFPPELTAINSPIQLERILAQIKARPKAQ